MTKRWIYAVGIASFLGLAFASAGRAQPFNIGGFAGPVASSPEERDRMTADLMAAIVAASPSRVGRLLDMGASPNRRDKDGTLPLIAAAYYADVKVMKILLDRGSDPRGRARADAVKLLLGYGADPNAMTFSGRTPLMMAVSVPGGSSEVVRVLLAAAPKSHAAKPAAGSSSGPCLHTGDIDGTMCVYECKGGGSYKKPATEGGFCPQVVVPL